MGSNAYENLAAIKKGSVWDTEVDVDEAGALLDNLNRGVFQSSRDMHEDERYGIDRLPPIIGNHKPTNPSLDFRYNWNGNENRLLAAVFGAAAAPAQQGATAAYLHALSLADNVDGIFFTYATPKGSLIEVVPSMKIMKMALTLDSGLLKMSFGVRESRLIKDSSIVTSLASVTRPSGYELPAQFGHAVFRMNDQSGDALDSGDVLQPKTFNLEIERFFDEQPRAGYFTIAEPKCNGEKRLVRLTLEFDRIDAVNEAYFADFNAGTEKKADITVTGPIIESTYAYQLKFQFPRLAFASAPEYADGKVIPAKIVLVGALAAAAPTGMTGLSLPAYGTLINTRTTGLLA